MNYLLVTLMVMFLSLWGAGVYTMMKESIIEKQHEEYLYLVDELIKRGADITEVVRKL